MYSKNIFINNMLGNSNMNIYKIREENKIYLYHYFDKTIGAFVNLSDIPIDEANTILNEIRKSKPNVQSAKRHDEYMKDRHFYEEIIRTEFIKKVV